MAGDSRLSRAGHDNPSFCLASLWVSSPLPAGSDPGRIITSAKWKQEISGVGAFCLDFQASPAPQKHLLLKKLKFTKSKEIGSQLASPTSVFW